MKKIMCFLLLIIIGFAYANPYPDKVYRGDTRSPETIKKDGGFKPRGAGNGLVVPPNISLYNHTHGDAATGGARDDSGYVSTSDYRPSALHFAGPNGYFYHIRYTGNFINVEEVLGEYSPYPEEREFAALGTIPWRQIIGWQRINNGVLNATFIPNPDYNNRFVRFTEDAIDYYSPEYVLAGFPPEHEAWRVSPWNTHATCWSSFRDASSHKQTCMPNDPNSGSKYFHETNPLYLFYVAVIF